MPVESATYISQLNSAYPAGTETKAQGDNHLRLIKEVLLATFPNADLAVDLAGIDNIVEITGNVSKVAGDFFYFPATDYVTTTATITLPAVSGVGVNKRRIFRSITTGDVQLAPNGLDTIDGVNANLRIPSHTEVEMIATASGWLASRRSHDFVGKIAECGTITPPVGWLECDGSSKLRADYAGLFAVLGTAFGSADGTHFNLPDHRGRTAVGRGTGTQTEAVDSATQVDYGAAESFTVPSNVDKWITGMAVVVTSSGALPTTSPAGGFAGTVYVIRNSSTSISFASSLANAVVGTKINMTDAGSGTHTVTYTLSARTLGDKLGEEAHANTISELAVHNHNTSTDGAHTHTVGEGIGGSPTASGWGADSNGVAKSTGSSGSHGHTLTTTGNSNAHNNMPPALVCGFMIKL